MEDDPNPPEPLLIYWVSFGFQTHAVARNDPRAQEGQIIALCGVMSAIEDVVDPADSRPRCTYCAWAANQPAKVLLKILQS